MNLIPAPACAGLRTGSSSSSMTTSRPALPSIFVMASIDMFVLRMLRDVEKIQVLVQRLQKGRHLHRASPHHVIHLYHVVEFPHLRPVIEVAQVPPDPLVYLLADKLVATRRWLSRACAGAYRHHISRVIPYPSRLLRLRVGGYSTLHERHLESGERVSGLESLDVPELDHLIPRVEVVVEQLRKENRAVLTASE